MDDQPEHVDTDEFRGATFRRADLAGATFKECDLRGARIVGSAVDGLRVSGFDAVLGSVFVDDVEVGAYVAEELDRRFPERVLVREASTVDELRAAWRTVERRWAETADGEATAAGEEACGAGVDGEWSFVETLRRLVFAIDTWIGRMIEGRSVAEAYHPLGLPPTDFPPTDVAGLGLEVDAGGGPVTLADAVALHRERAAQVGAVIDRLTDAELDEERTASLSPSEGPTTETVRTCLRVVLREHVEHRRFALRGLRARTA